MNCRHVQRASSAAMDGLALRDGERLTVDLHIAGCASCRAFIDGSMRVRTAVRIRAAGPVPDLTGPILAAVAHGSEGPARRVRRPRPRRYLPAIAAAIAGALVGSVIVGGPWASRSPTASAAEIARAISDVAPSIDAFQGSYAIHEHGLSPEVPDRELSMDVAYLAPQRFRLDVRDQTAYPSRAWTPTDIDYVENTPATYLSGPAGCQATLPGACSPTRETQTRRTRFSTAAPLPADLIAPIATFGTVDGVQVIGDETVSGHQTVHVSMSFERAAPLFPFLRLGGTWRPFFSQDRVDVWLDGAGWYPVRIAVSPSADREREDWEMRFGLAHERAGTMLLDVSLVSASSSPPPVSSFAIPGGEGTPLTLEDAPRVIGYEPTAPSAPGSLRLAAVVAPDRSRTSVLLYTDGLDYLRIGEDPAWRRGEPFGPVTLDAERVSVPGVGPALYEPAGDGLDRRLAIHTPDTDLFLDTNLPREELLAISSSLGVRARVPASWRRSRSGGLVVERVSPSLALEQLDLTTVRSALPAGYVAASAARTIAQGKTIGVTVTFRRLDTDAAGSALTLHRGTADANDDLEPNAVRVALGSADGLYTPATSSLSWADGGRSWWLQGDVDLSSLVEIATAVRRHAS